MSSLTTIYPSAIAHAVNSIDEMELFRDMPDGYFRVLIRIIKKINLRSPASPITAARSTLADESGKSIETVQRVVRWLEDRGLIEREQKARAGLRGSSSPLVPTAKLIDALLPSRPSPAGAIRRNPINGAKADSATPQPTFLKLDGRKIPADLAWMVQSNGMAGSGVLKLMSMAKEAKQRLSDVVESSKKYLEPLNGRAMFSYVRKLLDSGRDFTQRANTELKARQDTEMRDHLARKAQEMIGRVFRTRDSKLFVEVTDDGSLCERRAGDQSGGGNRRLMTESFLDAISAGRLVPCG